MNEDLKLGSILWPNFCSPFSTSCYAINESCSILAVGSYEGSIVLFKIDENENYINDIEIMNNLCSGINNVKDNRSEYLNCKDAFTKNSECKENIKQFLNYCKNSKNSCNFENTKNVYINNKKNYFDGNSDSKVNINKENSSINNRINLLPYSILFNNNSNTCNNTILQLNFGLSCCSIIECISSEILISLHMDNMIYFWSLDEGRCFKVLRNFDFFIYNLRILPDRRFLLISGDKKVLLIDLWANKDKEIIACLIIDNYKNKEIDNKEEIIIKKESDDNYIGDIDDKYYSSSYNELELSNMSSVNENHIDSKNNKGSGKKNIFLENIQINNKKKDNDNKICSIATGLVPYLKEENQRSLIQCFKLLKRKFFSIQEKKDKNENLSNNDFIKDDEKSNKLNEEYIKIKENEINQNLNNLFYCPVLICASLNNGDIICWDLTDFLNYYKSKCRFVVRTEKTEIELYNEIIEDIAENCIYDDLIKRRLNFSRDINLKTHDKCINKDIYKQNLGLYVIEPTFISNLQQSHNILEISTNGNSSQISIIDNYIVILQKTRLIIYERKNSSSFFVPLMDLFCPDFQESQKKKKKNSYWIGIQALRSPIWKFSSGVFKSISFKKKSFNIMQKLSKNVCGSIIAWTTEGNFYCYTLPLKFSSLFLSFQSNIKSFFLTKISKHFLGSFKSPVPIIIHRKKLSKSKEKEKKKNNNNNGNIEIKINNSYEILTNENKQFSVESIISHKNSNDDNNSLKNIKYLKKTNNINLEKYSKGKDDLFFFFINKNYMNRIILFEYLNNNWYKTSKIEKVWLLPKQKNIKEEMNNLINYSKVANDINIENNNTYMKNEKNTTNNGIITNNMINNYINNEKMNKIKKEDSDINRKIVTYAIVEYNLNIYIITSYLNGIVTSTLINTYKKIPKNKLIFHLPLPNGLLKKKFFITTLFNENNYLIGGSSTGDILIWNISNFKLVKFLKNCHLSYICSINKVINENFIVNGSYSNKLQNHWILSCDASNNLILLNIDERNYENNKDNFFCKNDEYKIVITTDDEVNHSYKKNYKNLNYMNTFLKKRNLINKERKYNLLKISKFKKKLRIRKLIKYYSISYNNTLSSRVYYPIKMKKELRRKKKDEKLKNMTHVCFHCCFKKLEKKNEINFKLINNIYINTYSSLLYIILLNNSIFIYNYSNGLFLRSIYDSEYANISNISYDKSYLKLGVNITNLNILNKIKLKNNEDTFKNNIDRNEYILSNYKNKNNLSKSFSSVSSSSSNFSFLPSDNINKLDKIKEKKNNIMNILNESKTILNDQNVFDKGRNKTDHAETNDISYMKKKKNKKVNLSKKIEVSNYIIKSQIPIISFVLFRDYNLSKKFLPLTKLLYHYFLPKNCINICKEIFPFLIDFPSIPFSLCIHGIESSLSFVIPISTQIYYFSQMNPLKWKKYGDTYITISNKRENKYMLKKKRKKIKYFYDCLNLDYDFSFYKKFEKKYFLSNKFKKKYIYFDVKMGSLKNYSKDFKELSKYKNFKKFDIIKNNSYNNHNKYFINNYTKRNKVILGLLENNKSFNKNYSNSNICSDYFKNEYNKTNDSDSNNSYNFNKNNKECNLMENYEKRQNYNILRYNYYNYIENEKKYSFESPKCFLNYSDDNNTRLSSDKSSIYLYIRKSKKKKKKSIIKTKYIYFNNTISIYCNSLYVKTLYCCFTLRFLNMWCSIYKIKYNDYIINKFKQYIVDNLVQYNTPNLFLLSYISMYPYDKSIRLQLQKFLLNIIGNISEKKLDKYTKASTEVLRINNKKKRIIEKNIDEISLYDASGTYIISIIIPKIGSLFLYPFIYADEICLTLLLLLLVVKAEYLWRSKTFYTNANMTTLIIHHICYYIFVDTKYFLEKNNKFNKFKLFHFIHLLSLSFSITWDLHILTQKGIFTNNMKNISNTSFNLNLKKEDFKFNRKLINNNYFKTLKNYYIIGNSPEEKLSNSLSEINMKNYIEDYIEYIDKFNEVEFEKEEFYIYSSENVSIDVYNENNNVINKTNDIFKTSKLYTDKYYHKYMNDDDKSISFNKNKSLYSESYQMNCDDSKKKKHISTINENNYINICHFILNLFELYTLSLNNISFLKILINIGRIEPFLFLKTLYYITANVQKRVSCINKILFLIIILIKNYKSIFIYYLNIIIDILLNSLDPSNNVRILCLKLSTSLIYTLVKHYPICSFNKFTQKLAVVNNINKCIYLYDLKNAKKLKIFQGHKKNINCIKFNTSGSYLASYSKLDLSFKIWNCTTTGLFSGFLKIQSKYCRDIQLSKIKLSYLYLSDDYIDIIYKKKNEWILKREDNVSYLIYI
ncbi:conserved Plasmodium protein, unknown function [Plasmodium gallinaceum]|uniref:WD repeat-containing protein n=1 Tax=Plasmodium gallinaceum TaxID=5849 RepID=A0A1J1GP77_PLAGA|nr:conserved Plasmodium protein, unknown function [Plasmodium gallinaceum]CRG94100.1 conserved Plasmodium protein, unknown function [Plasmodium gallinaceum]